MSERKRNSGTMREQKERTEADSQTTTPHKVNDFRAFQILSSFYLSFFFLILSFYFSYTYAIITLQAVGLYSRGVQVPKKVKIGIAIVAYLCYNKRV